MCLMCYSDAATVTVMLFLLMALLVVHLALLHGLGSGCAGGVLVLLLLPIMVSGTASRCQSSRSAAVHSVRTRTHLATAV